MERGAPAGAGLRPAGLPASSAASRSSRVQAKQLGRAVRPRRTSSAASTTRSSRTRPSGSAAIAQRATRSADEVWDALREQPGLAVVDSFIAPRRDTFGFGVPPDFTLTGFFYEDGASSRSRLEVTDEQTGKHAS